MACTPFNIVKEGHLYNSLVSGTSQLSSSDILKIYDGRYDANPVVLSGTAGEYIDLRQDFGEPYDVCSVFYYTDETNAANITLEVVTYSGAQVIPVYTYAAGRYEYNVGTHINGFNLTHSYSSSPVSIYQLEAFAEKNQDLSFGESSVRAVENYQAVHSTAGSLSSVSNVIPIYNESNQDQRAFVAISPTFTEADDYLYLATSSSGVYYGIDEHGIKQPGPNKIKLVDDPFNTYYVKDQWEVRAPGQAHSVTPTPEGLAFDLDYSFSLFGTSSAQTTGLFSSDFFAASSFTAEFKIRFTNLADENYFDDGGRDWFFVLTNSYPIPSIGYASSWATDDRKGSSVAGIDLSMESPSGSNPDVDNLVYQFRWVDGSAYSDPRKEYLDDRWTHGRGSGYDVGTELGEVGSISGPSMSDLGRIVNEEFNDFTSAATWHTWKLVYDYQSQKLSGYIDGIFLGSRAFLNEHFQDGCKLFIGFQGNGGVGWEIKDFKITPDSVYLQESLASHASPSATVSGSYASSVLDQDSSTYFVMPEPTDDYHIRLDFDSPIDLCYYGLKQKVKDSVLTAYGSTYRADFIRTAIVDYGGKKTDVHNYSVTSDYNYRSPTFSGTAVVVSGIEYLDINFVNYDRTSHSNNALGIVALDIFGERSRSTAPVEDDPNSFSWDKGRWINLKQYGTNGELALKAKDYIIPATYKAPEYLIEFVDYGYSSAVNGGQNNDWTVDYHHSESLFSSPGTTGQGHYAQWHSGVQSDNHIYIWRKFPLEANVVGFYWDSGTFRRMHAADKFKIQYLKAEGDPNKESDWINFPIVTKPHPYTGGTYLADTRYQNYKQYLIDNNDGEYYTSYHSIPFYGSFSLAGTGVDAARPRGLVVPEGYFSSYIVQNFSDGRALRGYIEFDEPVKTRAVRFVVHTAKEYDTGDVVYDFALDIFEVITEEGVGSYTSPVFDLGTNQNTERVKAVVRESLGNEVTLFVRASSDPPIFSYDPRYEVWETWGEPGNRNIDVGSAANVTKQNRAVPVDGKVYYFLDQGLYIYDEVLDSWSVVSGGYPQTGSSSTTDSFSEDTETAGVSSSPSSMAPDESVKENAALMSNKIYIAAKTSGDVRSPKVIYYDLATSSWGVLRNNRPDFSEDALMLPSPSEGLLYFISEEGVVSTFDPLSDIWVIRPESFPTPRVGVAGVTFDGKMYFFGGSVDNFSYGTTLAHSYDLESHTFASISSLPYPLYNSQAVVVPEERVIYVLPISGKGGSGWHATQKYFIDEDRWEVPVSLMWYRDLDFQQGVAGRFAYFSNGRLWRYETSTGPGSSRIARAKVSTVPWESGTLPAARDPVWGTISDTYLPWVKLDNLGEIMPQDRYYQMKAEFHSYDRRTSASLSSLTIVKPQEVTVPASGVSNVYLKVSATPPYSYHVLYTGRLKTTTVESTPPDTWGDSFSIFAADSFDGLSWSAPVTVSGTWRSGTLPNNTASAPYVLTSGVSDHHLWFTKGVADSEHDSDEIYYGHLSSLKEISASTKAVSRSDLPESADGATHPCVIDNDGYNMWYTAKNSGVSRIARAVSSDMINWTGNEVVVDIGRDTLKGYDSSSVYRPSVLLEDGLYRMWYTGEDGSGTRRILHSEGSDGVVWDYPRAEIVPGFFGDHDKAGCYNPFVLNDGSTYYLYYVGLDVEGLRTLIRAESPDGYIWTNPKVAVPPGGLSEYFDGLGVEDFFIMKETTNLDHGAPIVGGQLKLYNGGSIL